MKIECPSCGFSKEVDNSKFPVGKSARLNCPKCKESFAVENKPKVKAFAAPVDNFSVAVEQEPVVKQPEVKTPDMKACLYCGENILATAIKCKHCGEMLTADKVVIGHKEKTDALAFIILGIPLISTLLCWFWVGNMSLFQGPGGSLNLLIIGTIVITAGLAAVESNTLGMGVANDLNKKGKKNPGSVQWFFFISLLWIVGYPYYLFHRKNYGVKNLCVGGIAVAVVFLASAYIMGEMINSQLADIRGNFSRY